MPCALPHFLPAGIKISSSTERVTGGAEHRRKSREGRDIAVAMEELTSLSPFPFPVPFPFSAQDRLSHSLIIGYGCCSQGTNIMMAKFSTFSVIWFLLLSPFQGDCFQYPTIIAVLSLFHQ